MHDTLSSKFKGHIDNFYQEDGNLRLSGWIYTEEPVTEVVYYIDADHPIAFFAQNERPDVAKFYNTVDPRFINCGYDISIPTPAKTDLTMYALVRGQKEVIATLPINFNRKTEVDTSFANEPSEIALNSRIIPNLIVVDNFYTDPQAVREIALAQEYAPDLRYHKGQRTSTKYFAPNTKQVFESLIGRRITRWTEYEYNGIFQYCTAEDPLVYHSDMQSYAAAVYLTPDAPVETGTSFYRSKEHPEVRECHVSDPRYNEVFKGGFYDKTKFELVDTVGNVFNRCAIWNSKLIHSASQYFGTNKYDSRLFHLFFFDIEE